MSIKKRMLLYYSAFFALFISVSGLIISANNAQGLIFQLIFLPVTLYFIYSCILVIFKKSAKNTLARRLIIYYNFILTSIMTLMGFLSVGSTSQLISTVLFLPLAVYYLLLVIPKKSKALVIPKIKLKEQHIITPVKLGKRFDPDRRIFLKLIGSAGLSLFMLTLFTKKAEAAFFGSVPGPGTVAVKDTTGTQIDPAIKQPTDGYKIARLDDSSPAYYGFLNKDGAWFIMKENSTTGEYLYTKGSTNFATDGYGWDIRNIDPPDGLTYADFNTVFD